MGGLATKSSLSPESLNWICFCFRKRSVFSFHLWYAGSVEHLALQRPLELQLFLASDSHSKESWHEKLANTLHSTSLWWTNVQSQGPYFRLANHDISHSCSLHIQGMTCGWDFLERIDSIANHHILSGFSAFQYASRSNTSVDVGKVFSLSSESNAHSLNNSGRLWWHADFWQISHWIFGDRHFSQQVDSWHRQSPTYRLYTATYQTLQRGVSNPLKPNSGVNLQHRSLSSCPDMLGLVPADVLAAFGCSDGCFTSSLNRIRCLKLFLKRAWWVERFGGLVKQFFRYPKFDMLHPKISPWRRSIIFFWKASFLDIFRFHVEIAGSVSWENLTSKSDPFFLRSLQCFERPPSREDGIDEDAEERSELLQVALLA